MCLRVRGKGNAETPTQVCVCVRVVCMCVEDEPYVKVADFGLARMLDEGNFMTKNTGTYHWMAARSNCMRASRNTRNTTECQTTDTILAILADVWRMRPVASDSQPSTTHHPFVLWVAHVHVWSETHAWS